jgi:hypothetical protein
MFQLFLRTRQAPLVGEEFRGRSAERDAETERARVSVILEAVQHALHSAKQEQLGLNRRVEDALSRAAVTQGNAADEYLERDPLDSHHQNLFDSEIANGQRRLGELAATISHFEFLEKAILTRFPDFKPAPASSEQGRET